MFEDAFVSARFDSYMSHLTNSLGHGGRDGPFELYCRGLLITPGRKSAEPMAACLTPDRVGATHQSLLHIAGQSSWSDKAVLAAVREWVVPEITAQGSVTAWIVDDTGIPKKGRHSVGVARQYCGQSGKRDNCQVAVSLSVCTAQASLPVAYRLYLPQSWAVDSERRAKAGIPADIGFQTKSEIAMEQISCAHAAGITPGVVLMDAAYGNNHALRLHIDSLGLHYNVNVSSNVTVWQAGEVPEVPKRGPGRSRQPVRLRRKDGQGPLSVKQLAAELDETQWHTITWREGTNAPLSSRFAAVRVHHARRHLEARTLSKQEWLIIEWPKTEAEPAKYWLSNLPEHNQLKQLVQSAKMRWRIERDYQELKQELGLGHFEGRLWRGFHHHATLAIAAYGFLIAERAKMPPSAEKKTVPFIKKSQLPDNNRSRAYTRATPCDKLNSNIEISHRNSNRKNSAKMSMLPQPTQSNLTGQFVTQ